MRVQLIQHATGQCCGVEHAVTAMHHVIVQGQHHEGRIRDNAAERARIHRVKIRRFGVNGVLQTCDRFIPGQYRYFCHARQFLFLTERIAKRRSAHLKRVMITARITKMNSRSHRWGRRGGWLKGIAYPKAKTNYPVRVLAEWRTEYPLRLAPLSPPVWQCRESVVLQSCRSGSGALPRRSANLHLRSFP